MTYGAMAVIRQGSYIDKCKEQDPVIFQNKTPFRVRKLDEFPFCVSE